MKVLKLDDSPGVNKQVFAVHEKEITIGINRELIHLALDHLQRVDHWAIVDLVAEDTFAQSRCLTGLSTQSTSG
jgi:hypothetical protein